MINCQPSSHDKYSIQLQIVAHQNLINEQMARWKDLLLAEKIMEVIQQIQQFIEKNPTIQTSFVGIGNIEQNEGVCIGQEIKWFFQQLERNPHLNNPYDLLSQLSCYSEYSTGLVNWFDKMLVEYPECYKLRFALATALYNSHNHRLAQKHYQKVIKVKPDFVPAYIGLSWIQIFRYSRFNKALQYANTALSLDKNNFHAKLITAGFIPSFDKSMEILQQIKQTNPKNPLVLCAEAYRLASSKQDKQKIIVLLMKALSMNKTVIPYIYLAKGLQYNNQAKVYLQQAITIDPKSPLCYVELGYLHYLKDNYEMALSCLQKSLSFDLSAFFPLYLSGCIHKNLNHFEMALQFFLKTLQSNPYYLKAYRKLQEIYQHKDRLDDLYASLFAQLKIMIQMADQLEEDMISRIMRILQLNNDGCAAVRVIQMLKGITFAEYLSFGVVSKLMDQKNVDNCKQFVDFLEKISDNPQIYYCRAYISQLSEEWRLALDNYLRYLESPCQNGRMKQFQSRISSNIIILIDSIKDIDVKHQIKAIQGYFPDDLNLCWAVGQYLQKIGYFDEAVSIYNLTVALTMPSTYHWSLSIWKKMKFGAYSTREKIMLHKEKLAFMIEFHKIFRNHITKDDSL